MCVMRGYDNARRCFCLILHKSSAEVRFEDSQTVLQASNVVTRPGLASPHDSTCFDLLREQRIPLCRCFLFSAGRCSFISFRPFSLKLLVGSDERSSREEKNFMRFYHLRFSSLPHPSERGFMGDPCSKALLGTHSRRLYDIFNKQSSGLVPPVPQRRSKFRANFTFLKSSYR